MVHKQKQTNFLYEKCGHYLGSHFELSDCKQLKSKMAYIIDQYGQELRLF